MPITYNSRKIDPAKPVVALTFDDGPSIYTSQILDVLQQTGGRVSFFVTGSKVHEHKNKILRAMYMDCEIICHAWDHPDLTKISKKAIQKQLYDAIAAIAEVTGKVSLIFRPPYGHTDKNVEKVARKLGLAMVNWSVDPFDWKTLDAKKVYNDIANEVKSGDIVLCHDIYESTAEAMSRLIPDLTAQGCQLVTVSELLYHKYGAIEPGRLYLS